MSTLRAASSSRWRCSSGSVSGGSSVELAVEAHAGRDVAEELVDRGDADRREHRVAVGVGEREVAHCVARGRACGRRRRRAASRPRRGRRGGCGSSQPSPYGSSFTVSGASTTFWFTSSTSPESGAIRSETALTDSTSPYDSSFATVEPCVGRLVVDELAERVLREPGDAERRLVALDPRPVVLGVVLAGRRDTTPLPATQRSSRL